MDSNFRYAEAVKLVVAPFSCAGCLGRVGAPVGVGVLKVAEVRYHDRGDHPQPSDDFSCVVGYADQPPDPRWPGGARLALNFVAEQHAALATLLIVDVSAACGLRSSAMATS